MNKNYSDSKIAFVFNNAVIAWPPVYIGLGNGQYYCRTKAYYTT